MSAKSTIQLSPGQTKLWQVGTTADREQLRTFARAEATKFGGAKDVLVITSAEGRILEEGSRPS